MADKMWYYAKGDQQSGPITSAELKELAVSGKLAPTDQIWKEGMDVWEPAGDMKGLFPDTGAPPNIAAKEPSSEKKSVSQGKKTLFAFNPIDSLFPFAHTLLLLGFLLVIVSRGCDTLGNRSVAQTNAMLSLEKAQFDDKWNKKFDVKLEEIKAETDKKNGPDAQILTDLQKDLTKIQDDKKEEERKNLKGAWGDLFKSARDAKPKNDINRYWRGVSFLLGTILFVAGLIPLGFRGEKSERMVCLIILAIIAFSLYVSGGPWVSSLGIVP